MSVADIVGLIPVLVAACALVVAGVAVSAWWRYRASRARRRRRPVPTAVTGRSGAADTVGGVW